MKKLLLAALAVGLSTVSMAQTFQPEVSDTTLYGDSKESDFYGDIDIINLTQSPLLMKWVVVEKNLPINWEVSLCDPMDCRAIGVDSANFTLAVSSSSNYLNVHFYPNETPGLGILRVALVNRDSLAERHEVVYYGDAQGTVGIFENEAPQVSLYPVPAQGRLFATETLSQLELYNNSGQLVLRQGQWNQGEALQVQGLEPGTYYLMAKTLGGQTVRLQFVH